MAGIGLTRDTNMEDLQVWVLFSSLKIKTRKDTYETQQGNWTVQKVQRMFSSFPNETDEDSHTV